MFIEVCHVLQNIRPSTCSKEYVFNFPKDRNGRYIIFNMDLKLDYYYYQVQTYIFITQSEESVDIVTKSCDTIQKTRYSQRLISTFSETN